MNRASSRSLALRGLFLALAVVLGLATHAHQGYAEENLLHNGDFKLGSGDASVDGWETDGWIQSPETTEYHWIRPSNDQPGELELFTHKDNDARWKQPVTLAPGWYEASVEAKSEKVLPFFTGVNLSTLDNGVVSADLKGDNDWTRLSFYLKVGPKGADVDYCLRLGGYMNLTRGHVFFRNAKLIKIDAPPAGAEHAYDLDAIRKAQFSGPIGSPWTLFATYLFLLGMTAVGWRLLSESTVASTTAEAPVPHVRPRKKIKARGR